MKETDLSDPLDKNLKVEEFVKLLTANRNRVYAYIVSLVVNHEEAEDIMQETCVLLWQKFNEFQPGTDFLAWSLKVAYYRTLDFRKKKKKNSRVLLSDAVFQQIQQEADGRIEDVEEYVKGLQECVKKLPPHDQELIRMRYHQELTVKAISQRIGKTVQAVYYNVSRVQGILMACIRRYLTVQG